jgi:hypothetical protein
VQVAAFFQTPCIIQDHSKKNHKHRHLAMVGKAPVVASIIWSTSYPTFVLVFSCLLTSRSRSLMTWPLITMLLLALRPVAHIRVASRVTFSMHRTAHTSYSLAQQSMCVAHSSVAQIFSSGTGHRIARTTHDSGAFQLVPQAVIHDHGEFKIPHHNVKCPKTHWHL